MPTPGWGQYDITGRHIDALSVHHGVHIVRCVEHERSAAGAWRCERAVSRGWIIW
jgi:hypothetical protein